MTFCFTFPLCFPNLLYDIVLMELAVGVPSSSLWFGCSGHPVLPVLLWLSSLSNSSFSPQIIMNFFGDVVLNKVSKRMKLHHFEGH